MMLKLFVILVFAAVVFGKSSSTMSSLMTSAPKEKSVTPTSTATAKLTITATSTATAATTATPKPNTTAVSTTTPTPSNTTTSHPTISPTKTTAPPPTTTTALPTVTPPAPGNFSLEKNGNYCILAQFEASFTIQYYFMVNNTRISNSTTEHLDSMHQDRVNISGNCGPNEKNNTLVLSWPFYVFTMEFEKLEAASPSSNTTGNLTSWMVSNIALKVTLKDNPNLNFSFALVNKTSILGQYNGSSGPSGHVSGSYLCADNTPFQLSSDVNNITITSAFKHMRLEPFVEKKDALDFNKNDTNDCYQDHPTTAVTPTPKSSDNDIVPIAVGCALAGLVLIVLIAYVIGRRKSHSGYEKV